MLESIRATLQIFPKSFINRNNEIILIPRFNAYVCIALDNVETDDDFKVELCERFSRDCCCLSRYSNWKIQEQYYRDNTNAFNQICGTNFTVEQMQFIYTYLGNGIKHELTKEFVKSGFDISVIEKYLQEREQKQELIGGSENE